MGWVDMMATFEIVEGVEGVEEVELASRRLGRLSEV
jgi:hypothetical protein